MDVYHEQKIPDSFLSSADEVFETKNMDWRVYE